MKTIWTLFASALVLPVLIHAAQDRPNIVWLTSEDNSANWYRLYNPEHGTPMPNIERLAREGLVFNNAYSNAPVCSTARSTIISGCYGPRTGAQYHRKAREVNFPSGLKPFPAYLREAGYYTSNNSKKDYNYKNADSGWDSSAKQAHYKNRQPKQPFFHVQNYMTTHEGELFKGIKDEALAFDPAQVNIFPYHPDTPTFRRKYAQYLSLHQRVDAEIGKFIDELEAQELLDDTFIFHYGDHGGVLPGSKGYARNDGLQVAMVVYVPANWKHLVPAKVGSRIDGFVDFTDLAPTVLNLAGIEIPKQIDGKPFLGKGVTLDELSRRNTTFGYAERFDEKYDMVRFLRKGRYTYWRSYQPFNFDGLHNEYRYKQPAFVEWRQLHQAGKLNKAQSQFFEPRQPEMLFDLNKDPHETNNLANDPAYTEILLDLRQTLQDKVVSLPDIGFFPEPVFLRESNGNGTAFGLKHKEQIASLIRIADLQLKAFPEAKGGIAQALNSELPMERYWALITCSAFGRQAADFYARAKQLAKSDPNNLVRARAAEFLGLTGSADPMPYIAEVLEQCEDTCEANLVLNSVALLRDGAGIAVSPEDLRIPSLPQKARRNSPHSHTLRRIKYLLEAP
ncbi:MAG: sulfatase [Verrucomicrobiota bacterium]